MYITNAEIYTGRRADANAINDFGVTGNLVVRMTDLFRDQNYCMYTDRFYTTVTLAKFLLTHGILRLCVIAMTNRRSFLNTLK